MPEIEELKTYKIKGVEVFSEGVWNKDKYTLTDLYSMVEAFKQLAFKPFLKLGHDDNQKIAKSSGLPSIGWVENLYVKGNKLFADLDYIPKKIFNLIQQKAYRKVSCEIYWDLDINGVKYPRVLSAIALLGAEHPGVMNLSDILGNYKLLGDFKTGVYELIEKQDSFKTYENNLNNLTEALMSDDKVKELETTLADTEAKLDAQKKEFAKSEEEKANLVKEQETLKEELKKYREEAEKQALEAQKAKIEKFVTELESTKLISPAMKELVIELMSDKKEFSVKEKTYSKEDLIKEILKLGHEAAKVNFDEGSKADYMKKGDEEEMLKKKIEKYAQDNKCSYVQAYKAVMREHSNSGKQ